MMMREVFGNTLAEIMEHDDRICVLDADLANCNGTKKLQQLFPERAFEVGIAEQNMASVAAGLSSYGFIPFISSFTPFATRRICDQIAVSIAYAKQNVKIVGTDPGISAQLNGGTHMSLEDVGYHAVDSIRELLRLHIRGFDYLGYRIFRTHPFVVYHSASKACGGVGIDITTMEDVYVMGGWIAVCSLVYLSHLLYAKPILDVGKRSIVRSDNIASVLQKRNARLARRSNTRVYDRHEYGSCGPERNDVEQGVACLEYIERPYGMGRIEDLKRWVHDSANTFHCRDRYVALAKIGL